TRQSAGADAAGRRGRHPPAAGPATVDRGRLPLPGRLLRPRAESAVPAATRGQLQARRAVERQSDGSEAALRRGLRPAREAVPASDLVGGRVLAAEPRLAADAEALLHGLVLLAVLDRAPDEQGAHDHDRHEEEEDENDRGGGIHTTRVGDLG